MNNSTRAPGMRFVRVDCEVGATRKSDMVMGEKLKDDRGAGIDQGVRRRTRRGNPLGGVKRDLGRTRSVRDI